MKKLRFLIALILISFSAHSQSPDIDEMVKNWERAKAFTKEYLDAMPDSGYSFKPTPEMRSFAEQMLHLTETDYTLLSAARGVTSTVKNLEKGTADKSKANVIKITMDGYDFVIENIKKLSPSGLQEKIKLFGRFEMSKKAAIDKAFEHQTHQRGQTTVYLRLSKVAPPSEKLL